MSKAADKIASTCNCCSDLEKLLESGAYSDVSIIVGSTNIAVHKAILATRSPVFAAMFAHDMTETRENVVKIVDFGEKVVKELLRFVYSGKVNDLGMVCCELFVAADKYEVDGLKVLCERHLSDSLTEKNALSVLQLASRHNADALKQRVQNFIVDHAKTICRMPEFKSLTGDLKDELFKLVADEVSTLQHRIADREKRKRKRECRQFEIDL